MIIDNRNRRLRAFKSLHLTTSLAILLYSRRSLRFLMSASGRPHTKWDTQQDLRMLELLAHIQSTLNVAGATFKKAQLTQVADVLNQQFQQEGAPKNHSNVLHRFNKVATLCD